MSLRGQWCSRHCVSGDFAIRDKTAAEPRSKKGHDVPSLVFFGDVPLHAQRTPQNVFRLMGCSSYSPPNRWRTSWDIAYHSLVVCGEGMKKPPLWGGGVSLLRIHRSGIDHFVVKRRVAGRHALRDGVRTGLAEPKSMDSTCLPVVWLFVSSECDQVGRYALLRSGNETVFDRVFLKNCQAGIVGQSAHLYPRCY